MEYNIYKGLQKPLVFKGFKGKYIYWGAGFIVGALFSAGLGHIIGGSSIAGVFFAIVLIGGILFTSLKQKKGLYTKNIKTGVFEIPVQVKKHYKDENGIIEITIYRN